MEFRLKTFSYRFAEEVLNSKLSVKNEIEQILNDPSIEIPTLSRPNFNDVLKELFEDRGWESEPNIFEEDVDASAKMDFLKGRVGVEVQLGHSSFLGIDLLKFQVASYSGLDKIDLGIYITTTKKFQKHVQREHDQSWGGSLRFSKVKRYLPHFKSAIQVPIYVIGISL